MQGYDAGSLSTPIFGFHTLLGLNFAGWEWAPCWPGLLDIVWWLVTLMGLTGFVVSSLVPLASPRCTVLSSAPARRVPSRLVYRLLLLLPKHSLLSCSEPAQEHRSRGEHGGACVPWFSDRPLWSLSKAGLLHLREREVVTVCYQATGCYDQAGEEGEKTQSWRRLLHLLENKSI